MVRRNPERTMKTSIVLILSACLAFAAGVPGKYKLTASAPNGQEYNVTLVIKDDGGKASGTIVSEQGELALEDVAISGNDVTFKIPLGQGPLPVKLTVTGDTIKGEGKMGDAGTIPMKGTRDGASAPAAAATPTAVSVTGKWKAAAKTPDGQQVGVTFDLKQDGEKVTGSVTTDNGDTVDISEGKCANGELSFKVPTDEGAWLVKVKVNGTEMTGTAKAPNGADLPATAKKI